jgi:tRNA(Leu) C34 or U34 (ribose-2'-O)-methylase TrmL
MIINAIMNMGVLRDEIHFSSVYYVNKSVPFCTTEVFPFELFLKDAAFKEQSEFRLLVASKNKRFYEKLKENNIWVYGLELGGSDIYKTNLKGRLAIVIGGEDTGINRLTKEKCDGVMSIKMHGKINSLNASVACGVAVFEALRQRQN